MPGPENLSMFDMPPIPARKKIIDAPRHHTQRTSLEARDSITKPTADTMRAQVYEVIHGRGSDGATDEEIQIVLSINPSTERPRRGELVTGNAVVDSGRRRPTRSGRNAIVWVSANL
jgi:hypothetical protein